MSVWKLHSKEEEKGFLKDLHLKIKISIANLYNFRRNIHL